MATAIQRRRRDGRAGKAGSADGLMGVGSIDLRIMTADGKTGRRRTTKFVK
jgi:hypothetical protein